MLRVVIWLLVLIFSTLQRDDIVNNKFAYSDYGKPSKSYKNKYSEKMYAWRVLGECAVFKEDGGDEKEGKTKSHYVYMDGTNLIFEIRNAANCTGGVMSAKYVVPMGAASPVVGAEIPYSSRGDATRVGKIVTTNPAEINNYILFDSMTLVSFNTEEPCKLNDWKNATHVEVNTLNDLSNFKCKPVTASKMTYYNGNPVGVHTTGYDVIYTSAYANDSGVFFYKRGNNSLPVDPTYCDNENNHWFENYELFECDEKNPFLGISRYFNGTVDGVFENLAPGFLVETFGDKEFYFPKDGFTDETGLVQLQGGNCQGTIYDSNVNHAAYVSCYKMEDGRCSTNYCDYSGDDGPEINPLIFEVTAESEKCVPLRYDEFFYAYWLFEEDAESYDLSKASMIHTTGKLYLGCVDSDFGSYKLKCDNGTLGSIVWREEYSGSECSGSVTNSNRQYVNGVGAIFCAKDYEFDFRCSACYGEFGNDTSLNCSGHGKCENNRSCNCFPNYFGRSCEITSCHGVFTNHSLICSGHGKCIGFDNCECDSKFYGESCEFHSCYGIPSNETLKVCSGRGNCTGVDTCMCSIGSIGDSCEYYFSHPSFTVNYPSYPIGRCSEVAITTSNSIGYFLNFHWNCTSHPSIDSKLFKGATDQYIDGSSIQSGSLDFEVYVVDYWGRNSSVKKFSISRTNESVPQPVTSTDEFSTYVNLKDFYIQGSFNLLCPLSSVEFDYRWKQISPLNHLVNFGNETLVLSRKKLEFPNGFPFVNATTNYVFRFTINSPALKSNASVDVKVVVKLRSVEARTNESSRIIPMDRAVFIGAHESRDPENGNGKESFSWKCYFKQSSISSYETCVPNTDVEYSSTSKNFFSFTPIKEGTYKIRVIYSKDYRNNTSDIIFTSHDYFKGLTADEIKNLYIPEIRVPPIEKPVSKDEIAELIGSITPHKDDKHRDVEFEWKCPSLAKSLSDYILSESPFSINLILKPNILVSEITTFFLYGKTPLNISVFASVDVRRNFPPKWGKITVSPTERSVLQDFHISFQNWIDKDEPLEYSLHYKHSITKREKLIQPFTSDSSFRFKIPTQGCRSTNYSMTLVPRIRDKYHAVSEISNIEIIVKPVHYETIRDYFFYVTSLLSAELKSSSTKSEDVSDYLKKVIRSYGLFENINCTSLILMESFCMTYEECVNQTLSKTSDLFLTFQDSSLKFILKNVENLVSSDFEILFEILDLVEISNETLFFENFTASLIPKIIEQVDVKLSSKITKMALRDWWQRVIELYEKILGMTYSSKLSKEVNYENLEKLVSKYLRIALIGKIKSNPMDLKMVENGNIRFSFEKDYATNFQENKKYRTERKKISTSNKKGSLSMKIPSSIANRVEKISDILSASLLQVGTVKKFFGGFYGSSYEKFGDLSSSSSSSSSSRRRRKATSNLEFSETIQISFTNVEDSGSACFEKYMGDDEENSRQCSSTTYDESSKTLTCECSKGNSYYFVAEGTFPSVPKKPGWLTDEILGYMIGGSSFILLIGVCVCCCIPLIMCLVFFVVCFVLTVNCFLFICCGVGCGACGCTGLSGGGLCCRFRKKREYRKIRPDSSSKIGIESAMATVTEGGVKVSSENNKPVDGQKLGEMKKTVSNLSNIGTESESSNTSEESCLSEEEEYREDLSGSTKGSVGSDESHTTASEVSEDLSCFSDKLSELDDDPNLISDQLLKDDDFKE